eukprot:TRINITY_DN19949_c0_g1_i1.p1 TRINITY_DN19949_c0_g1~~TRINITY_DN19949_c0_g1_i1.p1  ORF type:complete len:561 (-),score=149.96 TRINITY_DN19949_c0_g1_i1:162-1769(-)
MQGSQSLRLGAEDRARAELWRWAPATPASTARSPRSASAAATPRGHVAAAANVKVRSPPSSPPAACHHVATRIGRGQLRRESSAGALPLRPASAATLRPLPASSSTSALGYAATVSPAVVAHQRELEAHALETALLRPASAAAGVASPRAAALPPASAALSSSTAAPAPAPVSMLQPCALPAGPCLPAAPLVAAGMSVLPLSASLTVVAENDACQLSPALRAWIELQIDNRVERSFHRFRDEATERVIREAEAIAASQASALGAHQAQLAEHAAKVQRLEVELRGLANAQVQMLAVVESLSGDQELQRISGSQVRTEEALQGVGKLIGSVQSLQRAMEEEGEARHSQHERSLAELRRALSEVHDKLRGVAKQATEAALAALEPELRGERASLQDLISSRQAAALAEVRAEMLAARKREKSLDEQLWLTDQRLGQRIDELGAALAAGLHPTTTAPTSPAAAAVRGMDALLEPQPRFAGGFESAGACRDRPSLASLVASSSSSMRQAAIPRKEGGALSDAEQLARFRSERRRETTTA